MKSLLWLDDVRNPLEDNWLVFSPIEEPYDVIWVKNFEEFKEYLTWEGLPDGICFDHDLGEDLTGYDCSKHLVELCMDNKLPLPKWNIHSQNPVGKENIKCLLENYEKIRTRL